jgi:hypothetical protein
MFGGYLRPSLRRRVALALAGMFIVGYIVVAAALNLILHVWFSLHDPLRVLLSRPAQRRCLC